MLEIGRSSKPPSKSSTITPKSRTCYAEKLLVFKSQLATRPRRLATVKVKTLRLPTQPRKGQGAQIRRGAKIESSFFLCRYFFFWGFMSQPPPGLSPRFFLVFLLSSLWPIRGRLEILQRREFRHQTERST